MATPKDGEVTLTTLPNGVRVVVETIPGARSLAAGVWVDTGSRDEAEGEAGITHFIEHMVFKGTARRRAHHIARHMESVGGYLNAFTAKEHTCYYARGLDEHLGRALDVVTDLVAAPAFPEGEIPKEQEVVVEELKGYEDQAEDLIFDRAEAVLYPDSPLGRPIIGTVDSIKGFTRDALTAYLDRHYVPESIVVSASGGMDPAKVVKLAERTLGALEPRPRPERPAAAGYAPATHDEPRPIQQAHLVLATRSVSIHDPQRTVLTVLNTILGGGMSSLLSQNVRERYGYCYNVYSFVNHYADAGDFGVYMATDPGRVAHAERLLFRELDRLASAPVSPQRLRQAQAQVKGGLVLGLENLSSRMNRLGRQTLYFGRPLDLADMTAEIDAVTVEQVRAMAEALFVPDRFSRVVLRPGAPALDTSPSA